MRWSRFSVRCPSAAVEAVVGIMMEVTGAGPVVEDTGQDKLVSAYVAAGPEAEGHHTRLRTRLLDIPGYLSGGERLAIAHELVQDEDWEQVWKEFYHPLRVGRRLVITPSWEPWPPVDDPAAARPDDIVIELDPEMAFGTGNHATTQLCLCVLEDLVQPGATVLDIGCGSGILSIAAARLGATRIVAIDVDPVAVATATTNSARNQVAASVQVRRGDLSSVTDGPFDLVVANVNAPVVDEIAGDVFAGLAPGGYYAASGLIERSVAGTTATQVAAGFAVVDVRRLEGWACVLGRRPDTAPEPTPQP